jgi:hypothetical protein
MKRKEFINTCSTCGAVSLLGLFYPEKASARTAFTTKKDDNEIPMNKTQIRELLKFIDSSVNEKDKKGIFNKLGTECFYSRNLDQWIAGFKDNTDEYFDRVQRGESKYWEKLEYDKKQSVITLIGRKSQTCACAYSKCDNPPESLCNYCCKRFQEEIFGTLLDKKVEVRIDESILLGGERCSTTIFVK